MKQVTVSTALQSAFAEMAAAASSVADKMISHLAHFDSDALHRLHEAQSAGHRTMLAIDLATQDPQVRFVAVGPNQKVTQIAAICAFPPSSRQN